MYPPISCNILSFSFHSVWSSTLASCFPSRHGIILLVISIHIKKKTIGYFLVCVQARNLSYLYNPCLMITPRMTWRNWQKVRNFSTPNLLMEQKRKRVESSKGEKGMLWLNCTNCSNYLEIKTNGNHACNHNATTEEKCLELYPIVKLSVSGKRCSVTISEFHPVPIVKIYSIKIIWSKLVIGKVSKIP